jgi:glycosyltransferase involved in cell wall biosynthesis
LTPNGGYAPGVLEGRRRWLKRVWIVLFEQRLWTRARFIHAVSEGEATELARLPGVPPIKVIVNGVNCDPVHRSAISPCDGSWLFIGRLSIKQKGLDLLLKAYAAAKVPWRVPPLRIVGPDFRGDEKALRALASDLGLSTSVAFEGALFGDQKRRTIAAAALLIQPSRWEGMPFSVLEAMAMGTPVLITGATNLAETVATADAGWTCQASVESITAAMLKVVMTSIPERERKACNARHLIRARFTWPHLAAEMAAAYRLALEADDPTIAS